MRRWSDFGVVPSDVQSSGKVQMRPSTPVVLPNLSFQTEVEVVTDLREELRGNYLNTYVEVVHRCAWCKLESGKEQPGAISASLCSI